MAKVACIFVRLADGTRIECRVIEKAYNPYQLFPSILVELPTDYPFGGQKKIVVNQSQLEYGTKGVTA